MMPLPSNPQIVIDGQGLRCLTCNARTDIVPGQLVSEMVAFINTHKECQKDPNAK